MMPQNPATAGQAAPAAPGTPVVAQTPLGDINLSRYSYEQLRARLQVIRDQRSDLASRRENLGSSYEHATGANKASIGNRLEALDNQIVDYEHQMAAITQEMARKAPTRNTTVPTGDRYTSDDIAGAVFGTFFATLLVSIVVIRRIARRRWGGGRMAMPQQNQIASNERLDRIENAVDAIAVEIERVSENQRFMTRLMTETQLGSTIKDAQKSVELAKSAAADQ
jgi:hypothetical protein